MSISRDEVAHVALLSRLLLSDEQLDTMTAQLSRIVDHVQQLSLLDTEGVEPMAHAMDITNVFAADEVQRGLDRAAALAGATKHDDECYRVPAVLGDG